MNKALDIGNMQGWLFDLDGVIWRGTERMNGAAELVAALRHAGKRVAFLTNNSSELAETVAVRLEQMGIAASAGQVITPLAAAGESLRERYGRIRVFAAGSAALAEATARAGHRVVTDPDEAEAVIMGRDPDLTYERLTAVCWAVDRGVPFLALNLDLRYPSEGGRWKPGLGTLVAAVTAATGRRPEVVGKPSRLLFETALNHLDVPADRTLMVGDTPASDIAGGLAAGMWTVLVGNAAGEPHAHLNVADPAELLRIWEKAAVV